MFSTHDAIGHQVSFDTGWPGDPSRFVATHEESPAESLTRARLRICQLLHFSRIKAHRSGNQERAQQFEQNNTDAAAPCPDLKTDDQALQAQVIAVFARVFVMCLLGTL